MTDHSHHGLAADLVAEAMKGTPPVTIAATSIAGVIDWQTWVLILTAFYLLMQIGWLGWKFWDKAHGEDSGDGGG